MLTALLLILIFGAIYLTLVKPWMLKQKKAREEQNDDFTGGNV